MKLFDMRLDKPSETFHSNTESVRDVQFNPHSYNQFCAVSENGKVQLWDIRRADRCEKQWPAHNNHVFACDWHPDLRNVLATAGRDKTIKVWDTMSRKGDKMHGLDHTINTIGPVGRVKWRPQRRDYLGSSALCIDFAVNVWDIKRPYVPFAAFNQHRDVTTDIAWRTSNPHIMISTSKDGTLYQHVFRDAVRPGDKANPVGLSFNIQGDVTHAHRQFPKQHNPHYPGVAGKVRSLGHSGTADIFKRQFTPTELFRMCHSKIALYKQPQQPSIETVTRETALDYQLWNTSFEEACVVNAEVARRLGRHQVALTWTVLKTVYSVKSEARPVPGELPATETGALESGRLRTSSLGTRKLSSKVTNKVNSKVNNKVNNKV